MRCTILLFVKYPEPGKVKTRLAASLGTEAATAAYRQLVTTVLWNLPQEHDLVVCYDPPRCELAMREWIASLLPSRPFELLPQGSGDLGARLERAFAELFTRGHTTVAVIGSDCIDVTPQAFADVDAALDCADVVLGPSLDGGYYLLALRSPCPALFRDMPWSTAEVCALTRRKAAAEGLRIFELAPLRDVDDAADWEAVQARLLPVAG